ncbi:acyltransferase [Desulfovibrio ferrophilus]|uniref:Acetyltransferase-like protein n=1 Tax=Desulfovibrio ferrophilus TaxID=241368 RepID=A0A2Z6B0U7_9BACT|nr:acyltransferase [Desulfovibrio ferrophilus]BBD09132.1 acetyltransferase -like protein [Desulfovibrio ferrophilus]
MSDHIHLAMRGEDNEIQHRDCDFDNVTLDIIGNDNTIIFGRYARLRNTTLTLRGSGHRIHIGAHCEIEALNLRLLHGKGLFAVGDGSFILEMEASIFEGTRCTLGRDCLVSRGVTIATGDAHSILDTETGQRLNPSDDITIGDHVWLGLEAMLLKGATIGADCVIGARAVVTGNIPSGSLAAGAPAKALRQGITWDRELIPMAKK